LVIGKAKNNKYVRKNNIISFSDLFIENTGRLKILYGLEVEFQEELYPWSTEKQYENLIIKNSNGGQKKIAQVGSLYSSPNIVGYFKSPFEDRIVFFIRIRELGGPGQGEISYCWVGCHLTVGF
jgi:hypothetical protein